MGDQFTSSDKLHSTGKKVSELTLVIENITPKELDDLALVLVEYIRGVEGYMVTDYAIG